MRLRYFVLSLGASLWLGACAANQQATSIAAAGEALTAADAVALKYVTLPLCPAGKTQMPNGTLCSTPGVSAQIKTAAAQAYAAYELVKGSPTQDNLNAVLADIATLAKLVPAQGGS